MKDLKRISIIFLLTIIMLTINSLAITGTVNAPNGLILRKEASKSGEVIMTISDKSKVEVTEKSGEWYKVKYGNYEGYLFAEYVDLEDDIEEPVEEEEKPQTQEPQDEQPVEDNQNQEEPIQMEEPQGQANEFPKQVQTQSNIKVYILPSVTASIINNIEEGKTITINKELNEWVNITFENKSGWVRKTLVENAVTLPEQEETQEEVTQTEEPKQNETTFETKKGYIDADMSVNVRETASTSATVIITLNPDTQVTVVGEENDFYKIEYKEYTGYVAKRLISYI